VSAAALVGPALLALRRRMLGLLAFSLLFLAVAAGTRLLAPTHDGHVEVEQLFQIGGYPLVSGLLLLGWVLGRFPLIAALVLLAGIFSHDRAMGYARIYAVRPVSRLATYGMRFAVLAGIAFILSTLLLPAFDVLLIGQWAGPGTFVLIAAYVLVYGSLVALLSVWTRADAWIALALAISAILWHALRTGGALDATPVALREALSIILPPHGALFQIETAFASLQPVPWAAFAYVLAYAAVLLVLAGVSLVRREI
jgi:hypothetical protein